MLQCFNGNMICSYLLNFPGNLNCPKLPRVGSKCSGQCAINNANFQREDIADKRNSACKYDLFRWHCLERYSIISSYFPDEGTETKWKDVSAEVSGPFRDTKALQSH